jgi:methyl-accepting chemotaxis protein
MLKKMKIGGKLSLAFGVLLLIFAGVGAMSWMNMSGVQREARSLAQEYVPELVIAADVRNAIQDMMYEVRGYGYTYQKEFLDAGRKAADEASAAVKLATDLAAKYPDLKVLKEGATKSEVALKEYMDLVGRTEESVNGIDAARKRADDGARTFLENAQAFLRSQNEAMHKVIKEGAEQEKLEERLEKITLINDIIDAGNGVRVDNFAGQATRNLVRIEEGVKRFTHITALMKDIRAHTRQQSNIDQLDAIQKAADQYKAAMEEIVSNWRELDTLAAQRVTAGQSIQTLAGQVVQAAAKESLAIADRAVSSLTSTILVILIATVVAVLLGAGIAFTITRSLVVPLKRVAELAGRARDGDFTIEREDFHITNRDELGMMADALAEMVSSQREMIRELKEKSVHLSAISEETAASTEEVTSTTNEVAESNAKLAEQTRNGRANAVESSQVMLEMSSLIQIAQSLASNADKNSTSMAQAADQGYETVTKTVEHMESIKGSVQETEELLTQLDTYSQRIGVVGDTITGLADQTNLLALNAAIEAARAGEAGRGFAVVAEEVRKLAEQSQQGAHEVAELVSKILDGTRSAVTSMQKSREGVEEGVSIAHVAGDALERIRKAIGSSVEDIRKIIATTDEEVAKSDKVIALIDTTASVMETTDDHVQNLAASMEETAAAMENVATGSQEVSETAEDLKRMTERFKVEKDEDWSAPAEASGTKKLALVGR